MSWISNYISIGNVQLPTPTSYRVQMADLDTENTTRDEAGVLHRERIRQGVYKLYVTWRLRSSALADLISLIAPSSFTVTFFDTNTMSYQTRIMYAGDRESEVVIGSETAGGVLVDFNVDFIEM